jgi:hypothetical protein
MKKELIFKIVVTFIGIVVVALVGIFLLRDNTSDTKGDITIEVINLNGEKVINDKISFKEGDTLLGLLKENYELRSDDSYGSTFIYDIDDVKTGNDTFLGIYVNDEMSMVGVDLIELEDGLIVSFRVTIIDYDYEE